MAKTTTAAMDTHLQSEVTSLAMAVMITRTDGVKFRLTTSSEDVDIDIGDGDGVQTYAASEGVSRTNIQNDSELNVDNLDVIGIFDNDLLKENELRRGLFDFADFKIFVFNHQDLTDGIIKIFRGQLGEVVTTSLGFFRVTVRSLVQVYSKETGEHYSKDCRADLGDSRCTVPVYPDLILESTAYTLGDFVRIPTDPNSFDEDMWSDFGDRIYEVTTAGTTGSPIVAPTTTVGVAHVQGTASFTAHHSWMRTAEVISVDVNNPRRIFTVTELTPNTGETVSDDSTPATLGFPDDWFNGGGAYFETGDNAGRTKEIRDFTADDGMTIEQVVELFEDLPFDIQVGDTLRLFPGCDKTNETCIEKFNNGINFVGEPYVPGEDILGQYPDAR